MPRGGEAIRSEHRLPVEKQLVDGGHRWQTAGKLLLAQLLRHRREHVQRRLQVVDDLPRDDVGVGEVVRILQALAYVLQVLKGGTSVLSVEARPELGAWKGGGRPPVPRYDERPSCPRELALASGEESLCEVAWREGSQGELRSRFLCLRARPANVKLGRSAAKTGLAGSTWRREWRRCRRMRRTRTGRWQCA